MWYLNARNCPAGAEMLEYLGIVCWFMGHKYLEPALLGKIQEGWLS